MNPNQQLTGLDYTPMPGEMLNEGIENNEYNRDNDPDADAWENIGNDDPVAQEIGAQMATGGLNLEDVEATVSANHIEGAINSIAADSSTQADTAAVEQNTGDDSLRQSYDAAIKAAESAVFADVKSQNIEAEVAAGDNSNVAEVEKFAQQAERLADSVDSIASMPEADAEQTLKIRDAAEKARATADEARDRIAEAQSAYESMNTEQQQEAQAAAEAAELNGTTVEQEIENIEEEKEAVKEFEEEPGSADLDGAIYG